MPATFRATGSFEIPSRRLFVVHGTIESGVVKKGMALSVRANSSFSMTMPIDAVEVLDYIKERRSEVGLCTVYRDTDELAFLKGLNIGGEVLEVEDCSPDEKRG